MVISPNGVKTELAKGTNISVVYRSVGSEGARIKAGENMKAVFWLGITFLTQISR